VQTAAVLAGFLKEIRHTSTADFSRLTPILIPFTNSKGACVCACVYPCIFVGAGAR
jgi:hypothetical protein